MIKATELRIGNYILFKEYGEGDGVIGKIKPGDFGLICGGNDEYHPIPLTPEWLGKFGFEQKGNGWSRGGFFLLSYKGDLVHGLFNGQVVNYAPIKYVHQLQNTYFFPHMIEELTIKEKTA